jgi:hypothetical protein
MIERNGVPDDDSVTDVRGLAETALDGRGVAEDGPATVLLSRGVAVDVVGADGESSLPQSGSSSSGFVVA